MTGLEKGVQPLWALSAIPRVLEAVVDTCLSAAKRNFDSQTPFMARIAAILPAR